MAGLLHRTAQPLTLAAFRPWEGSAGAGRVRPATANIVISSEFFIELTIELPNSNQFIISSSK